MPEPGQKKTVLQVLKSLRSLDDLKQLFWTELNYERENTPLSDRGWPDATRDALVEAPLLLAGGGTGGDFHVIYNRLKSEDLPRALERQVVNQLLKEHPYALLVFSNEPQTCWHFLNVKYDDDIKKRRLFRRITVRPGDGLRTAAERIAILDLESIGPDLFSLSPLTIQARHDKAFDVESVTKAFYKELANWYFWAREHAVFPKDAKPDADGKPSVHLIRLITRLIFCWFLREKRNPQTGEGLLPDALFDPRRIRELLKDPSEESCSYYTAILQNLFFATLNTEMDKPGEPSSRRFVDEGDGRQSNDHMVHTVWRHARQLHDPEALAKLLRDIPFLNGGLFECLDDRVQKTRSPYTEEVRIDGFSTDPRKQPQIPNRLFFGQDEVVDLSGAYGDHARRHETVRPLLSLLRRYNFTLTENTPLEQEVALDPELLGHVFENLLAAFNPETGTVARKATGSFYTPRVGVDWMVDQALTAFFEGVLTAEGTKDTKKKLRRLLSWEEECHDLTPKETEALIDAIDHLKALDSACGSGAFPMGLLQKLVHVLKKLDPDNRGWRRRQEAALDSFESSTAREEASLAIQRAFARDNDDYGRKLYLIEHCLYGVDIQPIACQIAKLRFFISLIVDQSINPKEPNFGILPLPNLETKIVAANTLLGLQRGQLLLGSDEVRRLEDQLQRVRHDYFTSRRYKDKKALRARDRELSAGLARALSESLECTPHDSRRLAEWNPYDANTAAPFFDPGWMFGLTVPEGNDDGVFDIAIGNPPYVRQEELKNVTVTGSDGKPRPLKEVLREQYECYTGTADLYVYFFERSLQLLRTGGVLSFITSNKYFRAGYGERLRAYLAYATNPRVILDFGDAPVFTSIAYPAILVTQKTRHVMKGKLPSSHGPTGILHPSNLPPEEWRSRVLTWSPGPALNDFPEIFDQQASALAQRDLKPDGWRLESPVKLCLLERLRTAGTPLGKYVQGRFYRGVLTGLNEAFVVDRATRDRLIAEHPSSAEVLKPFLRGRDVKRWRVEFADKYLIKIESSENKVHPWSGKLENEAEKIFAKTYPAIHGFFEDMRKALIDRYDQGKFFWELRSCDYWQAFEQTKVLYPDIYEHQSFAWDARGFYMGNTCYFIPTSEKWILALLNSPTVEWFYGNTANRIRGGYLRAFSQFMSQIPIPPSTLDQQRCCERLADALIWLHGEPGDVAAPRLKSGGRDLAVLPMDDVKHGLMVAFFEQWLNGLVYELFFPGELHARNLKLFDETARLNPPDFAQLSEPRKLVALQEVFTKAYDANTTLRGMLFDLRSLDVVRVIEDVSGSKTEPPVAGEA
jgi:adenine-specific DNA-methyltransferase